MFVSINPITQELKTIVNKHGADDWTYMQKSQACMQRGGKPATLVCKNNQMVWLTEKEIK